MKKITLLGFVNFQLYHSTNVKYPPILDPRLEALAADLYALSRYFDANHRASVQEPQVAGSSRSEQKQEEANLRLGQLQHQLPTNEPGALMHLVQHASSEVEEDEATRDCKNLFRNKKFFLSREHVLLVNRACHGDGKALEEKRARLGLVECVNHDLLQP